MKKIFLILLCSALIFSAVCGLGISASAEETTVNTNNLKGIWVFNDTVTAPSGRVTYTGPLKIVKPNVTLDSASMYFEWYSTTINGVTSSYVSGKLVAPAATVSIRGGGGFDSYWGDTYYFGNNDSSSDFFKWVKQNAIKIADEIPTHCNGSMCSTTPDENGDNICDECELPFVFSLRNDTYDYNGYSFAFYFEEVGGDRPSTLDGYLNLISSDGDMIILASSDNFDGSALYTFSSPIKIVDGKLYTSVQTVVSLYVASYTDDGSPYWKRSGTESWKADSYIATVEQVHWSADDLTDSTGTVVINGDSNFMKPLWEKVGMVTEAEIPTLSVQVLEKVKTLTVSSVGLLACGILLYLLVKILSKSRNM